jgi:hypothetical protein
MRSTKRAKFENHSPARRNPHIFLFALYATMSYTLAKKGIHMRSARFFISGLVLLTLTFSAFAQVKIGDTVLGYWAETKAYYVGTVVGTDESITGGGYLVIFRDGDRAILSPQQIKPMTLVVGSKVMAMWSDKRFYPGVINKIVGEALYILFDDGDKGWTGIAVE